jgi:hypothetical protein
MKYDELKPLKNIEIAFNTTTEQEQVIAEDSEGNCYGFDSWEEVYLKDQVDAAIAELKAENRKLKRALWLKRADDAKHLATAYENYDYLDCQEMTIKQEIARIWMTCKLRTAEEWAKIWKSVERKCRAKAERYKEEK